MIRTVLFDLMGTLLVRAPGSTAEAVYLGDSDIDIQAACDAGMPSILIRRPGDASDPLRDLHPPETQAAPDRVIAGLGDLPAALASLQPSAS